MRKGGKGQEDEREVGKQKWLRRNGEGEKKVGEKVQKEGGGAFVPTAAAKCMDKKRWKDGNVRICPENEWRGGSVVEWKEKEPMPKKDQE